MGNGRVDVGVGGCSDKKVKYFLNQKFYQSDWVPLSCLEKGSVTFLSLGGKLRSQECQEFLI